MDPVCGRNDRHRLRRLLGVFGSILVELDDFGNLDSFEISQAGQEVVPFTLVGFLLIGVVVTVVRLVLQRRPRCSARRYVTTSAVVVAGTTLILLTAVTAISVLPRTDDIAASGAPHPYLFVLGLLIICTAAAGTSAALAALATK